MKKTGIIILAAGNSSRLGTPKQLLSFEGKSLLKRITDEALLNQKYCVVIVLGASHEFIENELTETKARTVVNSNWKDGMSGSIKTGLQAILHANPDIEHCIISACDQPYINASAFHELEVLAKKSGKGIIATGFASTWGVPVLFSKRYFDELLSLDGQEGAKKIVKKHLADMAIFPFAPAQIDIDTKEDYYRLEQEMVSVRDAKEIIDFYQLNPKISKGVPIQDALGYALASDVIAKYAIPNFEQSSMDGYAIRQAESHQELQVADTIPAGTAAQKTLSYGEAMRIFTGAPLPLGADTVVMQEKVQVAKKGHVLIKDSELRLGNNVRPKGSEVDKDALAIQNGTLLTPAAIGYLAGIGCTKVDVYGAPRISLILTGDELKPLGEPLGFGEVYESNSYQLRCALSQLGIHNLEIFHVPDNIEQLKTTMNQALEGADVLLLVGGVSVGDYDYVTTAAKECGVEQRFHRIRQKPGKPMFFGTKPEKMIFGLPGNPSSALTCFYLYVGPALERIMRTSGHFRKIRATVTHDYAKKTGLTHFLKAHYDGHVVTPLHAQESYRLQSFAQANCLLVLEEGSNGCKAGDEVYVHLLIA